LTKEDLSAKLHAVEQHRRVNYFYGNNVLPLLALEEERHNKLMLKREHDHAVMNALDVLRKSEILSSTDHQDDHH